MFCHKKYTVGCMMWEVVGTVMSLFGFLTVLGLALSKCGCLKGKVKQLACECGNAVEKAATSVADAAKTCTSGLSGNNSSGCSSSSDNGSSNEDGGCGCNHDSDSSGDSDTQDATTAGNPSENGYGNTSDR